MFSLVARKLSRLMVMGLALTGIALAQVEIVYWTHEDPNRTRLEEELIAEFEAANPDIVITRVTNPADQLAQLILTAFAANRGPDVFNMDVSNEYAYIVNGRVAVVDPVAAGYGSQQEILDAYVPNMLNPVVYEGKLFGLPLELTNWAIFLNMNVFRDAGLDPLTDYPKTWEQMMEIADRLTIRNGEIITRRGFDFRYPWYLNNVVPMVEQLGGELISADRSEAIVGDEAWLQVLEYFRQWGPHNRNLGAPTYTNARALFNFDNNDIGMMESGQYQIARIANDNPSFLPGEGWMIIPFPQWENAVRDVAEPYYGHYFMVNSQSNAAKQEAAWRFVGFLTSHGEEYFERVAILQATQELIESDTFRNHPYSDVFMSDLAKASAVYYGEDAPAIQQALKDAIEAVLLQNRDPRDVLVTLRAAVGRVLRGEY